MKPIELKIAYIGGGSREWARKLMFDLALASELTGQVALYDVAIDSARLNEQLGNWLQDQPGVVSCWRYEAVPVLEDAWRGADFVTNVNMANMGQMANLLLEAVVETNAHFSRNDVRPLSAGKLPVASWEMFGRLLNASRDYLRGWEL